MRSQTIRLLACLAAGLGAACLCAARPANLICNGSFETGLQGWSWRTRGSGGYPNDVRVVSLDPVPERVHLGDAPHGAHVLRLDAPPNCSFAICSRAYDVEQGTYRARLFLRAEMAVTARVVDAGKRTDNTLASTEAEPGLDWQELDLNVTLPPETRAVALSLSGVGPGRCQIDQIELASTSDASAGLPVEIGLEASAADRVFFVGQEKKVLLRAFSDATLSGRLIYRAENAWGDEVAGGEIELAGPAGEVVERPVKLDLPQTGHYRLLAQFRQEDAVVSPPAELLLAVIPDRPLPTSSDFAEESRFGCNMENRPALIGLARKIGMRWVFCAPPLFTKWFSAEPSKGEWQTYDEQVSSFESAGLRLVGNLADPPYWATNPGDERYSGPWPNARLPSDWSDWESYVQRVVAHYHPRITHWAVWNEPNHPGYLKLDEGEEWVAKYITLLRHTYAPVKAVDPGIKLVGGTVTNPGALPPLIRGGGLEHMDIGAFHWSSWSPDGYLRSTGEEVGFLGPKETWVNCIERITDALGEAGKDVPLWNTECHITEADVQRAFVTQPDAPKQYGTPTMTNLDAAGAIPRQHITEWAAGVEKTFYWLLATYGSSWQPRTAVTLLEWDRSPTAALVAYAVMTDLLGDAEFIDWEKRTDTTLIEKPTFWTFRFRKPAGTLRVVWGNRDAAHEVVLQARGPKVTVWDMFGVERPGGQSMSGVELRDRVVLRVGRSPFYVFERD